jgi:hypothetical protein
MHGSLAVLALGRPDGRLHLDACAALLFSRSGQHVPCPEPAFRVPTRGPCRPDGARAAIPHARTAHAL